MLKAKSSANDQWQHARNSLKEAERAAGIEGILQALNKKESNEHNAFISSDIRRRREYRNIVFTIGNAEIRRRIIHFNRLSHKLCRTTEQEELQELQNRIKNGGRWSRNLTVWSVVVLGIATVLLADEYGGEKWARIATVAAVLFGVDCIRRIDRFAISNMADAKEKASQKKAFLSELGAEGDFTQIEEETGQPEKR